MKLHVIYDNSGKIVAGVRVDAEGTTKHPTLGSLRPVVKPGHFSAEVDVPEEHTHLTLADLCLKLVVQTSSNTPQLRMPEKP
jgi:hypothetical protein